MRVKYTTIIINSISDDFLVLDNKMALATCLEFPALKK